VGNYRFILSGGEQVGIFILAIAIANEVEKLGIPMLIFYS